MSALVGLPVVGLLLLALILVRDYAKRDRLGRYREQRRRRNLASSWVDTRSERAQMRESADHVTVMRDITRTGPQAPHVHEPGRDRKR